MSYHALRQTELDKAMIRNQNVMISKKQTVGAKIFITNTSERNLQVYWKASCWQSQIRSEWETFRVFDSWSSFQELQEPDGLWHLFKASPHMPTRRSLKTRTRTREKSLKMQVVSKERKPWSTQHILTNEVTSNTVVQDGNRNQISTIILVYVWGPSDSSKEVFTLLDSHSDSLFILEEVADVLDTNSDVKLELSTIASKRTIVPSKRLKGLQVRGLFSTKKITVPTVYLREFSLLIGHTS